MLCTSARVVPNDDGKPNDHLIPFGLRDIRMTRGAMPRPAVRVAASAPCGLCATAINASADNSNPDEGMSGRHAGPVSARLGSARRVRTCDQSCSMFCIIVLTYSSHACTQFTVGIYLLFDDRCMHVGGVLSGADLISLHT